MELCKVGREIIGGGWSVFVSRISSRGHDRRASSDVVDDGSWDIDLGFWSVRELMIVGRYEGWKGRKSGR